MENRQFPQPQEDEVRSQEPAETPETPLPESESNAFEPEFFTPEMIPEDALHPSEDDEDPVVPEDDLDPEPSSQMQPLILEQSPESLLSQESALTAGEDAAAQTEPPMEADEDPVPEDLPEAAEETRLPEEAPELPSVAEDGNPSQDAEEPQADKGAAFMARIPDVDDGGDVPEETQQGYLSTPLVTPEMGQELTPDDQAMDYQGMLGHGEEEPPFDLSILEGPAFQTEADSPEADDSDDQEYRDNDSDFDAMFGAAPAQQTAARTRPPRKGRPKRKKGEGLLGIPNILVTIVWLALILAIGVTAGRMLWVCAAEVLAFGKGDQVVTVTVYESDTMEDITNKLYDAGLIRYKSLFNLYASISDAEEDIKPGIYDLNTRYDYHALVNFMSPRSSREVIELTIPEGYTCRQIFQLLEENRICTAVDIGAYAAEGELSEYWFLDGVARGDEYCLEGFLFPDTYEFYRNSTPREALEKMLDNFETRFDEEMRLQVDALNAHISELMRGNGRSEEYISQHLFTVREVTIVASMIEKETASNEESPTIASVIYNRLFNWGDTPAYLNIDASIVYALNGKTDLTSEDLRVDSPYNTYTNIGLTPTPISNPGLASLEAALNPATTNYYFYVLNPSTGSHQFSTTQDEHEAWRTQFANERVG